MVAIGKSTLVNVDIIKIITIARKFIFKFLGGEKSPYCNQYY